MRRRRLPAPWAYVRSYLHCLPALPTDGLPCLLRRSSGDPMVTPRGYVRAVEAAFPEPVS